MPNAQNNRKKWDGMTNEQIVQELNTQAEDPNVPRHLRTVGTVCCACGAIAMDIRRFLRLPNQRPYDQGLRCAKCLR